MNAKLAFSLIAFGAVVMIGAQVRGRTGAPSGTPKRDPKTVSLSNIKQLSTAMMIYITDSDDIFPYPQAAKGWQWPLFAYCKNKEIYKSANPKKPGPFLFNFGLGGVSSTVIENPAATPMFYDPTVWPDGRYLYSNADTSSKFVDAARWKELQKVMAKKMPRTAKKPLPKNYGSAFSL